MRSTLDRTKTRFRERTARLSVLATALLATPLMGADCSIQELAEQLAEDLEKACVTDMRVTTTDEDRDPSQPDAFFVCQPEACTLRDAIATANACGGSHTVVLPSGLYELTSPERSSMNTPSASMTHDAADGPVGLPVVAADIRIYGDDGDAAIARIEDADPFRIFHVASGASLELQGILLAGGLTPNDGSGSRRQDGGGILNDGLLTLEGSAVVQNTSFRLGGGVANYGELRAAGSAFALNLADVADWLPEGFGGGALFNGSSSYASIERSHVYQNLAGTTGYGGAVANWGELEIVQGILAENRSAMSGGAIYTAAGNVRISQSTLTENGTATSGGALHADELAGDVAIQASTLSANWADNGGAAYYKGAGEISIEDATVVHSAAPGGAALYIGGGTGRVANTIVANAAGLAGAPSGWTGGSALDCLVDGASVEFAGPGIDSDGSCAAHFATTDPELRPLADNYGFSPTHALEPWSPALDTGVFCSTLDQRSLSRPEDGDGDGTAACDLGAFEAQPGEETPGTLFDPLAWIGRDFGVGPAMATLAEEP